jgi:hypothetical protein
MTHEEIILKFKELGLLDEQGRAITFYAFKNKGNIRRYGSGYKILFIGQPGHSIVGFYFAYATDNVYLKAAYDAYAKVVEGDTSYVVDGFFPFIKFGEKVPIAYSISAAKKIRKKNDLEKFGDMTKQS